MARWIPRSDEVVGPNEHVGRRLFNEPMLAGAQDQKPFAGLDYRHFEEKRDGEVSLDRLGRSSVEKAVVEYLRPRACGAGTRFHPPKPFNGWIVLKARQFGKPPTAQSKYALSVNASPITGSDLDENIYHAHVSTPENVDAYSMALHLRQLFATHGMPAPVDTVRPGNRLLRCLPVWARGWLSKRGVSVTR